MRDSNPHEMKPTRIPGTSKSMNANKSSSQVTNVANTFRYDILG